MNPDCDSGIVNLIFGQKSLAVLQTCVFSSVQLESGAEQDLDVLDQTQSDYLSAASDVEDTDGEVYTDHEDLEEAYPGQDAARPPRIPAGSLARSSEPALGHDSPIPDPDPEPQTYQLTVGEEIPPLMLVPEPASLRRGVYSPPQSPAEDEDPSHRSFTDSDFSHLDAIEPTTPSDGPPDFIAPDPPVRLSVNEPSHAGVQHESPQHPSLSAIEEKLQQVNPT